MEAVALQSKKEKSRVEELGSFIGSTPLFPIQHLSPKEDVNIYAKLEWQQFGASVKARPAYQIIKDAISKGELGNGKAILDATSGNTGIAYAHIGAALDIPVTLFMPENASKERKTILRALGVDLRFTPADGGTDEAQQAAVDLYETEPENYFYANQYDNPNNWKAHYHGTGPEIMEQTDGTITHFIAGMGTTGTFTGTGKYLKSANPAIQIVGLQPEIALHGLEGWKHLETNRVPKIYDRSVGDEILPVSTDAAYEMMQKAASLEGLLIGPSGAANLAGAVEYAQRLEKGTIVTVLPDDSSKYGDVLETLMS